MTFKVALRPTLLSLAALITMPMHAHAADADGRSWKSVFELDCPDNPAACTNAKDQTAPQIAVNARGDRAAVWQVVNKGVAQLFGSHYTGSTHNWSNPVRIDSTGTGVSDHQVAIDAAGIAMVVWVQSDGVQAAQLWTDGTAEQSTALQSRSGRGALPRIAMSAEGAAIAVWDQSDGAHRRIWARRYSGDTLRQWDENAVTLDANVGEATAAQVAMNSAGNALVAWQQDDTQAWANQYSIVSSGWLGAQRIPSASESVSSVQVVLDRLGIGRAVWIGFETATNHNRVWASRWFARWEQAVAIDLNGQDAAEPQIAVDESSNALAAWSQSDGVATSIWSNRTSLDATRWDGAALVETVSGNAFSPSVSMDRSGNAIALWHQKPPGSAVFNIYGARYTPAATVQASWQPPALVESDDRGNAFQPRVAFDDNGTAAAVWSQSDGIHFNIKSTVYGPRQWTTAVKVGIEATGDIFAPHAAMGANGTIAAVWAQRPDAVRPFRVFANRYVDGRWGTPAMMQNVLTGDEKNATVAVDAAGNTLVLWDQTVGRRSDLWWNFYSVAAGQWAGPQLLHGDTRLAGYPQLVFDRHANAFVAIWSAFSDDRVHVWSSRFVSGVWTPHVLIDDHSGGELAQLAVGDNGNAVAAWRTFDHSIAGNWSTPDGKWGTATTLRVNSDNELFNPTVTIDQHGNALAFWSERVHPETCCSSFSIVNVLWSRFVLNTSGTGGSWTVSQPLLAGVPFMFGTPVAFTPDGNASMLGSQGVAPFDYRVRLNHYTASLGRWDGFTSISVENPINPNITEHSKSLDSLVADPSGGLLAVWSDWQSDGQGRGSFGGGGWYNNFAVGSGWSTVSRLTNKGDDPAAIFWQQGVLNASGNGALVWAQTSLGDPRWNIWARRFE